MREERERCANIVSYYCSCNGPCHHKGAYEEILLLEPPSTWAGGHMKRSPYSEPWE